MPDAAIDAAFNNLPIGKAVSIRLKIKGLRACIVHASTPDAKLLLGIFCA